MNALLLYFCKKENTSMVSICNFKTLTERARQSGKKNTVAIVCPNDSHTQYVIERALEEQMADFILVTGGETAPFVSRLASQWSDNVSICHAPTPDEAAAMAVGITREGKADILMKGTINTDNLLRAVLNKEHGLLEKGHVMTHITVTEIPSYSKLLLFSDAAVIPRPTLEQFDAILGYTATLCRQLGTATPRVALIHCTEKVNEKFPHTISYEALKDYAAKGKYGDIVVDGPMDVKTACDADSGAIKGIVSPVAGNADALIFPNIESGNVFYKTITLFAQAQTAGMLAGTTAPIVVASRADTGESKFYSLALACVAAEKL